MTKNKNTAAILIDQEADLERGFLCFCFFIFFLFVPLCVNNANHV